MSANPAIVWDDLPSSKSSSHPQLPTAITSAGAPAYPYSQPERSKAPALRVMPILQSPQPRRFVRVPTHAVGVHLEQRECPRASLKLPLKLRSVAGILEQFPVSLVTRDISSSGVYFLCPKALVLGTQIELDIVLISRPLGYGNVVVSSRAKVCRTEAANMPGWFGVAASFDDFAFDRDDNVPTRFSAD